MGYVLPGTFYLVSSHEYPNIAPSNDLSEVGTMPPITEFSSSFAGKTIEDAAEWLENGPQSMFLQRADFAVIDDNSEKSNTITICRRIIGGSYTTEHDEGKVQFYPCDAEGAGGNMFGGVYSYMFDDALDRYQKRVGISELPDLSRGKPYQVTDETQ